MQFLPASFTARAVDIDGDGVADPHDIDDAVATAANYLCGGRARGDRRRARRPSPVQQRRVLRRRGHGLRRRTGGRLGGHRVPRGRPDHVQRHLWLAPRSGGRQHKGVDILAAEGTPIVAPVAGVVELREDTLGGLAFHLWGDDGNYYYGAHLSGYAGGAGRVEAGIRVGYIGRTGNASVNTPHLHFEIHLGRTRDHPAPTGQPDSVGRCRLLILSAGAARMDSPRLAVEVPTLARWPLASATRSWAFRTSQGIRAENQLAGSASPALRYTQVALLPHNLSSVAVGQH
ncbi:MAG: M23 family metallopeptidase [Acidimicrobiales bacterium]